MIFSLSDIQWNTNYNLDANHLPTVETDALEIENTATLKDLLYNISPHYDLSTAFSEPWHAPNAFPSPHSSLQDQLIMANLAKVNEEINSPGMR